MTIDSLSDDARALKHRVFQMIARADNREPDAAEPRINSFNLSTGLSTANAFVEDHRARFTAFMTTNWEGLSKTFGLLADNYSRDLFVNLLAFGATRQFRIDLLRHKEEYVPLRQYTEGTPASASEFGAFPGGQSINRFDIEIGGKRFSIDCLRADILSTFLLSQYSFSRDGVEIRPGPGDHIVDAGARFGDIALNFSAAVGSSGHIYSFDPLDEHLRIMKSNIERNGIDNVTVFPTGLGDRDRDGKLVQSQVNPVFNALAHTEAGPIRSVDNMIKEGDLKRVDFLKMDIKGKELPALRGAASSIRRFLPKLAISLYHRWESYIEIPSFIDNLGAGYKFYLEHYDVRDGETVLYCASDKRPPQATSEREQKISKLVSTWMTRF